MGYAEYMNGSLALFVNSELNKTMVKIPSAMSAQYMRLGSDGHLRVYEWSQNSGTWEQLVGVTAFARMGSALVLSQKTRVNSTAYIKVQNVPPAPSPIGKKSQLPVIIGSSLGALFVVVLLVGVVIWKTRKVDDEEEIYLDQVPGMPTRFSYEILQATTENFSKKLGAGGFGSVFEVNMMRVAAWCLQADFAKRPSMSTVVKVLEGVMDVKVDLDYNFFNLSWAKAPVEVGRRESEFRATTPLLPSVLSGPR
ncbi:hypothetical protein CRG98_045969 [Punica granatum]|uniref:Protein kinase domain-containing protein n=1 Tax=Punica granatum TaxID=22663 RepID=A0A2I0HPV7_PUNGR|nr:hypothetical protein CRG98_045969 [Punica granatum]